jgi:elongation of very long chain fatty acids protein 6
MVSILSLSSSAIDSLLAMKPMFDFKPLNENFKSKSNITQSLYTHIFGFENLFESHEYVNNLGKWMQNNWTLSVIISVIYMICIFAGRRYMESRPKYELRMPLLIWNLVLAIFSIVGAIRVWPEFIYALTNHGIVYSVCDSSYAYSITGFWAFMFCMSKLPELVDTLFIVLRKQKLIFLHWYHHATVLIYCWFSYKDFSATGRWFMNMNYLVHAIMYSYYACKAMRLSVPLFISKIITASQILQMIAGIYVNWVAYQTKSTRPDIACNISDENIKWSSIMYLSYFVLFFHFFLEAYIYSSSKKNATNRTLNNDKKLGNNQNNNNENNSSIRKKLNNSIDANNNHELNGGDLKSYKKRN